MDTDNDVGFLLPPDLVVLFESRALPLLLFFLTTTRLFVVLALVVVAALVVVMVIVPRSWRRYFHL